MRQTAKNLEPLLCRHYGSIYRITLGVEMGFELLTKDEVAARVHISRRYLERRIASGTGPETLQVGRRVLVRSDAFQAWIEGLTVQSRRCKAVSLGTPPAVLAAQEAAPADLAHGQSLAPAWPSSAAP